MAGIEHTAGVAPPIEEMKVIGASQDASFFDVARPLERGARQSSGVNFQTESVAVTWSLEKVIGDLQILSILLHNTVSALRIFGGVKPGEITFKRVANAGVFWDSYFLWHNGDVPSASIRIEFDVQQSQLWTEDDVLASYRSATSET